MSRGLHSTILAVWGLIAMVGGGLIQAAAAPPNDNFANAIVLTGFPNLTATNIGATAEIGEPAHAGEPASKSLWWKWTPPYAGSFSIVTSNSYITNRVQLDTTLAVYTGSSLTNLVKVAENDDTYYGEFGATWSRLVFRAYPTETLMIAVDSIGAAGSIQLRISPAGPISYPWWATNLDGQLIYSTNFLGQVVMVDFWETICGACNEEYTNLISVQAAFHDRGFTFIGLSGDPGDDPVSTVKYYLHTHPVN
ncbi:MAG TPA: TlpA disulfide reductase family protein, partial [Candidatus Dormibacteraeota bacterium]|nr:TlpA disulfide reductase family protein [Candidatus Dormibacteraeota bacterium]